MAHWVAVLSQPERKVFTGKTKQEVIFEIGSALTNRSRYLASSIERQLHMSRESMVVAYGENGPEEEIAKVFPCNCGSVRRHTE